MAAAGAEDVEEHRESARVETPKGPAVKWLWKEKSTEAVLEMLTDTGLGCVSTRRILPEETIRDEEEWALVTKGKKGDQVPPIM